MAIKMSPDELEGLAGKLSNASADSQNLASQVEGLINSAVSNWEGAARERYIRDFEEIKPVLAQKLPETLQTLSDNMKTMAREFRDLDAHFG
jgi:WXG100 family type VII secretion target